MLRRPGSEPNGWHAARAENSCCIASRTNRSGPTARRSESRTRSRPKETGFWAAGALPRCAPAPEAAMLSYLLLSAALAVGQTPPPPPIEVTAPVLPPPAAPAPQPPAGPASRTGRALVCHEGIAGHLARRPPRRQPPAPERLDRRVLHRQQRPPATSCRWASTTGPTTSSCNRTGCASSAPSSLVAPASRPSASAPTPSCPAATTASPCRAASSTTSSPPTTDSRPATASTPSSSTARRTSPRSPAAWT